MIICRSKVISYIIKRMYFGYHIFVFPSYIFCSSFSLYALVIVSKSILQFNWQETVVNLDRVFTDELAQRFWKSLLSKSPPEEVYSEQDGPFGGKFSNLYDEICWCQIFFRTIVCIYYLLAFLEVCKHLGLH